ncbi:hypothetical protein D9M73_192630 [compost metagenome]
MSQHRRLIEPALTQAPIGQRHRDQRLGSQQIVFEAMLQVLNKKFGEQAAKRPLGVVFEAGDQAVYRKAVGPGRNHLFEGRWLLQAMAAGQSCGRERQGAGQTVITEPGQLDFAGRADRRNAVGRFIAQKT